MKFGYHQNQGVNDWILTEYNNQRNPDLFIIVGDQETTIEEPIVSNEIPRTGEDLVILNPILQDRQ